MAQPVVGQNASHHRLGNRRTANADARVMAALGNDIGFMTVFINGPMSAGPVNAPHSHGTDQSSLPSGPIDGSLVLKRAGLEQFNFHIGFITHLYHVGR